MVKIKINSIEHEVEAGRTILEVARDLGIEIPHFCYHPGLSIAGNCRMCLVEVKGMPKLMTACSTTVQDDMDIYTDSDVVKEARKGVLEFILLDHPVDCPICDKSGECDLQDYNFDHGVANRRSIFPKERHKVEKVSEKIYKNDNRCVLCTRCIRFLEEVTGTGELTTVERGSHTHIVCTDAEALDKNPFAGNISDLCPVGALGLNEHRFRKRVWFTETKRGVCQGCEAGCNIMMDVHNRPTPLDPNLGPVIRFISARNYAMQRFFICDEGRESYKRYNLGENRLMQPRMNGEVAAEADVLEKLASVLEGAGKGAVVLSPLCSLEENYAAMLLAQEKGFKVYRPSAVRRDLPEPALFIEKVKAPNQDLMRLLNLPKITDAEELENDVVVVLHNVGAIRDNSVVKLLTLLKRAGTSIVFEPVISELGEQADMVLPAPIFVEEDGCFLNVNRRLQRSRKALPYPEAVRPLWEWLMPGRFKGPEKLLKQFGQDRLNMELSYDKLGEEGLEL